MAAKKNKLTTYEIVQAINQAAKRGQDGYPGFGEAVKVGLRREECDVKDRRMMDGFKVSVMGDVLRLCYTANISIKEMHNKDFESENLQYIKNVKKFLKKEYKDITKQELSLEELTEPNTLVQHINTLRTWLTTECFYKVGGMDLERKESEREKKLKDAYSAWFKLGKS